MTLTDGRLGARPARSLVDHVNAVELTDELDAVREFVLIDLAHALMLTQQGIFTRHHGRSVVAALLKLLDHDPRTLLASDPEIGTITLQLERYLHDECGPAGLDIQRARSRIDQKATGVRMADRRALLEVVTELLRLAETLLECADSYDQVIVPGYTHLQHAQPTSLGHYLNAHYWTTSRNLTRLLQLHERLNECPLGGAAYSGTAWPIDRDATATYLGFARPVRNARDAGLASMDTSAELAGVLGLVLSGLSRCASDLYYWSSSEIGAVRLHPSLCGTSSMMPQKRNPIVLERIRGLAGDAAGWGASRLGLLHFATSTDADQGYVHNRMPEYCRETAGAAGLLREVLATLKVDVERLESSAGRHWSTASALADDLVSTRDLSFRAAHEVVARFIAAHEAAGEPDGAVRPELAEEPLRQYSAARLSSVLDARSFVESRTSAGGTSTARLRELAAEAADDLDGHRSRVNAQLKGIDQATRRLLADARALVASD
ncbi:argininosuccinate lyase [Lentzea aerocolonigenes]|uniref:argininosuccinate lyase n=1 Tax=Lentzea aerocolonigenes TaxID=68170 RepID=UPI0004C384D3|nr:argininosuccinate lyase [Lentzea aerocolonigenes]MCP2244481.1 argininosuccinate lyase [Lentzea aerocolonigenes]